MKPTNPTTGALRGFAVIALCLAALGLVPLAANAALTYNFTNGLQGWTQMYPTNLAESLWANYDGSTFAAGPLSDDGHLGDGWEDRDTQLGRSPAFYLDSSGDLTFTLFGCSSPLSTPADPASIPETAVVGGGFMGVALRDVVANTYLMSRSLTTNVVGDTWAQFGFTAAELVSYTNDGKQYTIDFIDYDKNPGVGDAWIIMGDVSIPGSTNGPGVDCQILVFGLPGKPAVITGTNIAWLLPFGTAVTNLAPTYVLSSGATCNKASGSTNNFTTPQTYTVVSGDHASTNVYTVTVTVAPVCMLTFGPGALIVGTEISWRVPSGTDAMMLAPTYTISPFTTCDPASGSTNDFTTPKQYTVTSEDHSTSVVYTVTVYVSPAPWVNVNIDVATRTDLVGPAGGSGATWNEQLGTPGLTASGLLDSNGVATTVGFTLNASNVDPWGSPSLTMLTAAAFQFAMGSPADLVVSGLATDRKYDLYLASFYPNESGGRTLFSSSNTTTTVGTQIVDNGGGGGIDSFWVEGTNFARFLDMEADSGSNIVVTMIGDSGKRGYLNGFQLVELIPEPGSLGVVGVLGVLAWIRRRAL